MALIDILAAANNAFTGFKVDNKIRCADGFSMSVVTGGGSYSVPRGAPFDESADGPYTAAEVGFPSARPEPWDEWSQYCEDPDKPTRTVYAYVPAHVIRALIDLHGGER